ncbi:MAG: hypothetical protein IKN74_04995 [Clostridia bacterium]|nr:hypothetical protein [Clostridia bacterium]
MKVADFISDVKKRRDRIENNRSQIKNIKGKKQYEYEDKIPSRDILYDRVRNIQDAFTGAREAYKTFMKDSTARSHFNRKKEEADSAHRSIVNFHMGFNDCRNDGSNSQLDSMLFEIQALEKRGIEEELEFIKRVDIDSLSDEEKDELKRAFGEELTAIVQMARGDSRLEYNKKDTEHRNREHLQDVLGDSLGKVDYSKNIINSVQRTESYLSSDERQYQSFLEEIDTLYKRIKQTSDIDMEVFEAKVKEGEAIIGLDRVEAVIRADCLPKIEALSEALEIERRQENPFGDAFEAGVKKQTKDVTRTSLDDLLELLEGPSQSKGPDKSKDASKDDKSSKLSLEDLFL